MLYCGVRVCAGLPRLVVFSPNRVRPDLSVPKLPAAYRHQEDNYSVRPHLERRGG